MSGLKTLVIEDDPVMRKLVQARLTARGHSVTACADARSAWEACRHEGFLLVVLDWMLPDMDGLTLCRRLRTLPHGERCVILVVTANDKPEDLKAVLDAGADDYLAKPVDVKLLEVRLAVAERQARSLAERLRLEREVLEISTSEQERIGRDLHDTLGQSLTGITYLSRALESKLKARGISESTDAAKIEQAANEALVRAQHLAKGLYPVELDVEGFRAALHDLAETVSSLYGIPCRLRVEEGAEIIAHQAATQLYRIAQEAVNNAVKHARARQIEIGLTRRQGDVVLTVRDDGRGFAASTEGRRGLGAHIMRYRARLIGAALDVEQSPSGGTEIRCTLRVEQEGAL